MNEVEVMCEFDQVDVVHLASRIYSQRIGSGSVVPGDEAKVARRCLKAAEVFFGVVGEAATLPEDQARNEQKAAAEPSSKGILDCPFSIGQQVRVKGERTCYTFYGPAIQHSILCGVIGTEGKKGGEFVPLDELEAVQAIQPDGPLVPGDLVVHKTMPDSEPMEVVGYPENGMVRVLMGSKPQQYENKFMVSNLLRYVG